MINRFLNLLKLVKVLRERGNWPLIRRSKKQLLEFLLCRSDLNRKSIFCGLFYWFYLLKGLDVLIWRLETFGFLFLPSATEADKEKLNRYL